MNATKKAKVIRIIDGILYHLKDSQNGNIVTVQIQPTPTKLGYYHFLKTLSESEVTYEMVKKGNKIKEQTQKAIIYLNEKQLSDLYQQEQPIIECTQQTVYEKDQIIQCYIMEVQCLKIKLYLLNENKYLTFYFSEFKLPKVGHTHPKQVWQKAENYFKQQLLGDFVQIKVNGSENYHQMLNVYGEILRLHNGLDIKEKALEQGYAELSKNCEKYLTIHQINKYNEIVQQSKNNKKGIWKQQIKITKGSNQLMEQKYKQWEEWNKNKKKLNEIKNAQHEVKQIGAELKKNSATKSDPNKCRILLETVLTIFQDCVDDKNIALLEEFIKIVISCLINIQTSISLNTDNLDFLRYLNKLIILIIFYVMENQKLGNKNKMIFTELEKIIKVVFKCCFIGNETFHEKVFGRKKQSDFQTFEFDPAYLSGISSYSEYSQSQQGDRIKKENKAQKKIISAQTKIRINATLVISNIFKNFSPIVQNYWQICVNSNILTKDFLQYLQTLKISIQPTKIIPETKKQIASLMKTNFGDYSLVLLVFFEQNAKVKMNALNCMIHMINNFQSRKIIDTTEASYVQKLLNQTKSSFVPKSFIVFSGLRNALYFMLFSLHHERNVLIIVNTFKALTQLCQQSTLIDKMGFIEGMGLLMSNYINPVLQFSWEVKQLTQLKCLCIQFLGALVNTQKKWEQMENEYLMSAADKNINMCLLKFLNSQNKEATTEEDRKIIVSISKYFKSMAKRYYPAIYFEVTPGISVWNCMSSYYIKSPNINFTHFVEEIFKCHYDQLALLKSQSISSRKIIQAVEKAETLFGSFLSQFIPIYSHLVINENYISLINILSYIPYHKWSQPQYEKAKQFLIHCFESVNSVSSNKNFPSFNELKTNSLVRLSLIKLLGYISFCKEFQTPQYSKKAIRSLLQYSKQYKSINTVTKITWGISNWSNIDCFKEGLTENQLKECLDYMIKLSQSDNQKVASNCTRGIGFFLANLSKNMDLEQCRSAIIKNLLHPIIKVRTNSTKTLRMMIANNLMQKLDETNPKTQELINILQQNILKNNYHLQIETVLLIKDLGYPIKQSRMMKIYSHILHTQTSMDYEKSQVKALKQLRRVVLQEMVKYPKYIAEKEQTSRDFCQTVQSFLLDSRQQSLRKQAEDSYSTVFSKYKYFEKGEQVLKSIFNIKNEMYDNQKMIRTQFTMKGISYEANQEDLGLLQKIREVGRQLCQQEVQKQTWRFLSQMSIQGRKVSLGQI